MKVVIHSLIIALLIWGVMIGKLQFSAGYLGLYIFILTASKFLKLSDGLKFILLLTIPIGFSARLFYLYRIPNYDKFLHFIVPTLIAYVIGSHWRKIPWILLLVITFGLGLTREGIEYTASAFFKNYSPGSGLDSSVDLIFNTLGALAALIIVKRRNKHSDRA